MGEEGGEGVGWIRRLSASETASKVCPLSPLMRADQALAEQRRNLGKAMSTKSSLLLPVNWLCGSNEKLCAQILLDRLHEFLRPLKRLARFFVYDAAFLSVMPRLAAPFRDNHAEKRYIAFN